MRHSLFEHKDTRTTLANEAKPVEPKFMQGNKRRAAQLIIEKKYNDGNNFRFIKDLKSYIDKHRNNPAYLNALVSEDHRSTLVHLAIQ